MHQHAHPDHLVVPALPDLSSLFVNTHSENRKKSWDQGAFPGTDPTAAPRRNSVPRMVRDESQYCSVCGKRYKNLACLKKHAWEHHECWNAARRLMLSKHHCVQMMEAAQALVCMTRDEEYQFKSDDLIKS